MGSGNGASLSIGAPLVEHGGRFFTGDLERKVKFLFRQDTVIFWRKGWLQATCKRRLRTGAFLSIGGPLGFLEEGSFTEKFERQ
jgi:hypothetical protein